MTAAEEGAVDRDHGGGDGEPGRWTQLVTLARCLDTGQPPPARLVGALGGMERALEALRAAGIALQRNAAGAPARPVDWLDAQRVRQAMGAAAGRFQVRVADCVDSTNTRLLDAAAGGAPGGTVLAAELQLAGRGRGARRWEGDLGTSLLFSLLWRFGPGQVAMESLGLVVGTALAVSLRGAGVAGVGLKWPNDLLLNGDKVAGILVETRSSGARPAFAVLGIGLNVEPVPGLAQRLGRSCAALRSGGLREDRSALLGRLLAALGAALPRFEREGFAAFRADWEALHVHQGCPVQLHRHDGSSVHGIALGVSPRGELGIQTADGPQWFGSGELSSHGGGSRA